MVGRKRTLFSCLQPIRQKSPCDFLNSLQTPRYFNHRSFWLTILQFVEVHSDEIPPNSESDDFRRDQYGFAAAADIFLLADTDILFASRSTFSFFAATL